MQGCGCCWGFSRWTLRVSENWDMVKIASIFLPLCHTTFLSCLAPPSHPSTCHSHLSHCEKQALHLEYTVPQTPYITSSLNNFSSSPTWAYRFVSQLLPNQASNKTPFSLLFGKPKSSGMVFPEHLPFLAWFETRTPSLSLTNGKGKGTVLTNSTTGDANDFFFFVFFLYSSICLGVRYWAKHLWLIMWCSDICPNIILGISVRMSLDEINIWISRLSRADCSP